MMKRPFLQIFRSMSGAKKLRDVPDLTQPDGERNKAIGPTPSKWLYNSAGFNQYGLMRDDCLRETPVVEEALRRLPQHILDERTFRIVRAGYLSLKQDVLPKEQWTKIEEDVPYLQPYIKEVEAEIAEKKAWEAEE